MKTLLLVAGGLHWWIVGPQMLVKVDEQRSVEASSHGSRSAYIVTRYFCPVDSTNGIPEVVVALRGVVTPRHRQINYNAIMLKCPPGYSVVEPQNPYVSLLAPRQYRRVCVGQDEHTGPWHLHISEAVKDCMDLVRHWFDADYPVLEMTLDAQLGVESAVIADGGELTQEKWHGNFYDVRDLAVTKGWMDASGGRWRLTSYDADALAAALLRVQEELATGKVELPPEVVKAVNEQFWDLV